MKFFATKLLPALLLLPICSVLTFSQSLENGIHDIRQKWTKLLIGDENLNINDPIVIAYINDIEEKATLIWNAMVKKSGETDTRMHIFTDLPITSKDRTGSSQITFTYDRLKTLALAYKLPGTTFSNRQDVFNEIVAALDMMVNTHYSVENSTEGTGTGLGSGKAYGNWYDWRIGTPLRYNDLLCILADDLSSTQLETYVAPVLSNNKAVDTTGANRTWIAGIVAQAGILLGRADLILMAKNGLKTVFPYVSSGDGYYLDGSFVQHTNYAYNGGYGKALLCIISPLMYILKDTAWEISYSDNVQQIFYDMIFEAYEPFIYGGRFMDMVREREISRLANQDHIPGRQAIRAMILLLDVLEGEQKERAERMIKDWLADEEVLAQVCFDPNDGFLEYTLSAGMLTKALEISKKEEIIPRGKLLLHKRYASMDRVVHLKDDFAFGLAMSSCRIRNTEGTNDEGLRLWHIGDGMTYLYNEDKDTYADHFWATVDYQRLPGTTVVRTSRGTKDGYGTFNPNTWVGGTQIGEYGVSGMQFKGLGTSSTRTLDAKKSWFMFDDEIVAIGSDIILTSGNAPVETIVENRKINEDFSNRITLNGNIMTRVGSREEFNQLHEKVQWIHLESSGNKKTHIGYYFPDKPSIQGIREARTGSWDLVNTYFKFIDTRPRKNNYVTFWFDHGNSPQNESYAYVLLPGKSSEETKEYNDDPDIKILKQDGSVHAVRENKLGITAINFWAKGTFDLYTASAPASFMVREIEQSIYEISISDPTQKATTIYLDIDKVLLETIYSDEKISVQNNDGRCRLVINTSGAAGKSFFATLKMK